MRVFGLLSEGLLWLGVGIAGIGLYHSLEVKEVLFPFHCLYFISTYKLSYPSAGLIRLFVWSWLLCFSEFAISAYYAQTQLITTIMYVEYLVCFVSVCTLERKELIEYASNTVLRTLIFGLEGFIKSWALIGTIEDSLKPHSEPRAFELFVALAIGGAKMLGTPLIHAVDQFLCWPVPMRHLYFGGFKAYARLSVIMATGIVLLVFVWAKPSAADLFAREWDLPRVVTTFVMMSWYVWDSIVYGNCFQTAE